MNKSLQIVTNLDNMQKLYKTMTFKISDDIFKEDEDILDYVDIFYEYAEIAGTPYFFIKGDDN